MHISNKYKQFIGLSMSFDTEICNVMLMYMLSFIITYNILYNITYTILMPQQEKIIKRKKLNNLLLSTFPLQYIQQYKYIMLKKQLAHASFKEINISAQTSATTKLTATCQWLVINQGSRMVIIILPEGHARNNLLEIFNK